MLPVIVVARSTLGCSSCFLVLNVYMACSSFALDPENSTCFGGQFGYFISKYLLGYEMMIIASFKDLLPAGQGRLSLCYHTKYLYK